MDWDPSFFHKSPFFWPIARPAAVLARHRGWPSVEDLGAIFEGDAPVRFAPSAPKPRRKREPGPAEERYDAQIAVAGVVPTRQRSWHDLLNALVWGAFPAAKLALHARQHRMIAGRLREDLRLPGSRTKEQDAVAMLDEGGVVVLMARAHREAVLRAVAMGEGPQMEAAAQALAPLVAARSASVLVFGHGIYESIVCAGFVNVRAAAYVIEVETIGDARACVAAADAGVAQLLSREAPIVRGELASVLVGETLAQASAASA